MSAEEAASHPGTYRYAYLGLRRSAAKVHILHVGHGVLCCPYAVDYWVPQPMSGDAVTVNDDLWITLVAAHTLCARCRRRFEETR